MKRLTASIILAGVLMLAAGPSQGLFAQDDEGPGTRITTVTSFNVPFGDRGTVIPFMVDRVLPATQLNPKAITVRLLFHNWGSDASQVAIVAEYASLADVDSECGQPCKDYFDANPIPEEGTPEREAFDKAGALFSKYYSRHSDEIYVAPMGFAKVEGKMVRGAGMPEAPEGDGE